MVMNGRTREANDGHANDDVKTGNLKSNLLLLPRFHRLGSRPGQVAIFGWEVQPSTMPQLSKLVDSFSLCFICFQISVDTVQTK